MSQVIPKGWTITQMESIADWGSGGTPSRKNSAYYGGKVPWIKTGDLGNRMVIAASEFITEDAIKHSSAKWFNKGSVIMAMYGATIGRTSILGLDATTNQACAVGNPIENITSTEFLYYLLCSEKDSFIAKGKGGAQPNISQALIKAHEISLPPLAEQKEIVAQLDKVLAQVESTTTRLDAIPAILKRFRQSVLAAAVSGKLTDKWRVENEFTISQKDIESAFKQGWETEKLKEFTLKGKEPKTDSWKGKLPHPYLPTEEDQALFTDIPQGWELVSVDQLTRLVKDGPHFSPKYSEDGIPFISGRNITVNGINFSSAKYISAELHTELSRRCKPEIGDVLLTKGGTTGVACVNVYDIDFNVWVHVAVLRVADENTFNSQYLCLALNSPDVFSQSQAYTHGVANRDLGLTRMIKICFPIPNFKEQTEIVRRVDELLAYADTVEAQVNAAQERVNNLSQSILAKAFSGELTAKWRAQNPDLITGENSATALLDKIKTERAELTGKKKPIASKRQTKR
jgi:type I restriction enzyme S subunit